MSNNKPQHKVELADIRGEIDLIDQQLIQLLTKRSRCVEKIGAFKCAQSLSIYDATRENHILEKITQNNPTLYQAVDMANIFNAILRAGLNQQLLYRAEHEE